jgi:exopolysaccharide biosynthesis polyprenyl glycosylphosphotransferase
MTLLYRFEEFKETIMFLLCRSVTIIVGCCFAVLWMEYYSEAIMIPFFRKGNWAVMVLYVVLYHLFTSLYGGYKIGSQRTSDVIYSNWLSLVIVNAVTYLQISLIGRMFMPFVPFALVTALQFLLIFIWVHGASRIYFRMFTPKRLVLLYGNDYPAAVIEKFNAMTEEFRIAEVVEVLPENNAFIRMISGADGVVIYDLAEEKASAALKYCVEHGIRYYLLPSLSDILLKTSEIIYLVDVPLFMAKNDGLSFGERLFKRFFDILCSLILIALFSPLMLIVAACIKLYDGGPAIYRQERCTQHGRRFNILKFRSMKADAEKDGVARLAEEDDPRITPVGCFIRKYRIDELPQFFNILKGDMSFVGPRPERPEIIERYKKTIPEFDCRLSVKCGLTGYAQVIGRYNTTPEDKLKLDLMYIQSYSLLQDFKILLMTIKVVLSKERSAGVKKC